MIGEYDAPEIIQTNNLAENMNSIHVKNGFDQRLCPSFFGLSTPPSIGNRAVFDRDQCIAGKTSAHLEKGLLKVVVPRLATEEKKPRQIPVGTK